MTCPGKLAVGVLQQPECQLVGVRSMRPLALFVSAFPVSWLSTAMHDCEDIEESVFNRVEHSIGKYVHEHTPDLPIKLAPSLRGIAGVAYCRKNGIDKAQFQSRLSPCVESGSILEFREGVWVELESHPAYLCLSLAKASSPEIPVVCPDRSSCSLRCASEAHKLWMYPSSAGSRLSTSRSASKALASLGSARASSAISSTRICMEGLYERQPMMARTHSFLPTSPVRYPHLLLA